MEAIDNVVKEVKENPCAMVRMVLPLLVFGGLKAIEAITHGVDGTCVFVGLAESGAFRDTSWRDLGRLVSNRVPALSR